METNDTNMINNNGEMTAAQMLRNARTTGRRKREIQTIAKLLCIREEFLEALEAGDYHKIPEVIYVLGFARNYAMELGLDPDEIVLKIKREMGLVPNSDDDDDAKDEEGDVLSPSAGRRGGIMAWLNRAWRFVARHWMWFFGALVAIVAVTAVVVVMMHKRAAPVAAPTPVPVVTETNAPAPAGPAYTVTVREQFGTENAATANVILQATQESWVKVEDARGNTIFSRVLVPGDIYYVPAGDRNRATFGNAGGIDIWVNGVLAPKQGADHVRRAGISLAPDKLLSVAQ